ncbi:FMN reductase [NAD(P)H] [Shimwellia blattae]|nr:FMN reductase [NAD(P)H] [Shimwellia blattae]
MSDTLDVLRSHRSDRSYLSTPVPDDVLQNIVEAAWRAPTSVNSQQVSLVVVRDPQRRAQLAELAGGQPWIAQARYLLPWCWICINPLWPFAKRARSRWPI